MRLANGSKKGSQAIQLINEMLAAARAKYREVTKHHLSLHGVKRESHKTNLSEAKDRVWELELRLAEARIAEAEEKLSNGRLDSRQEKSVRTNIQKWQADRDRLLSRLDHDEWLGFTRSVWPFKETESTAKTGLHPAQFSAVLPYRAIKMYSYVGETVLDPFVGTGTTLLEARKLGRHSIGLDVNPEFLELSKKRLRNETLNINSQVNDNDQGAPQQMSLLEPGLRYVADADHFHDFEPELRLDDARAMPTISDSSIDLIVTHPPYWNAVQISELPNDLSNLGDDQYHHFLLEMGLVFDQFKRVLKPDRVAVVVIGDVMRKVKGVTQLYPLHADFIQMMRERAFVTWDIFIWETKIRKSGGKPLMGSYPYPHKLFSQFAHNYVLVFRKLCVP